MSEAEMIAIVEALLFVADDAVPISNISNLLGIGQDKAITILDLMTEKFDANNRGLRILRVQDTYRLATSPAAAEYIRRFKGSEKEKKLSRACLETLSIIAYQQPVTRADIDNLRGVDSANVISTLIKKGMIMSSGRAMTKGRPIQYITTDHFLRCLGYSSIEELPDLNNV